MCPVTVAGLRGAAVGDEAIAVIHEEEQLRVPVIGRQRPSMAEHDTLTVAQSFKEIWASFV